MIELQDRKGLAKYLQVRDIIHAKIRAREYAPGSLIPSESELTGMFGVAKMTVRQALAELEREGMLRREQGRGTFVEEPVEHSASRVVVVMALKQEKLPAGGSFQPGSSLYYLMSGIMGEAHRHDLEMTSISLELYQKSRSSRDDRNYIFVWPLEPGRELAGELAGSGKNVILINRIVESNPNITWFSTDHYFAGRGGTEKMIARGHRKIGLVILPRPGVELREQGYREAMAGAGLEVEPDFVCHWDRDRDNTQFEPMLRSGVTAVLVAQGLLLPYLMRGLNERNIRVPGDLEIITFNHIPDEMPYKPYIHEIIEPFREIATLAVRKCLDSEDARNLKSRLLKPEFKMKTF